MKNVILLTIDALRKDVLGCYGNMSALTPFIDSIQDKCIQFTNAHATGPYTQASFPGILASSYYLDFGRQKNLPQEVITVSEVLKKEGIATAGLHSNPYLSGFFGWNRGWDHFFDSLEEDVDDDVPYITAEEINNKAAQWLERHCQNETYQPFFLWVHYMDVHEPYVPDRKYLEMVDDTIDLNAGQMLKLFSEKLLERDVSDQSVVAALKKLYCAQVRKVNDKVRHFFEILQTYGILKDTVVIIMSDHGDEFLDHGGLSHDGKMYAELVNVPLMIYEPDRNKKLVVDTVVSTIDISPTIIHLLGLDSVKEWKGSSLLPLDNYLSEGVFGEAIEKHGSHEKGSEKEVHYHRKDNLKIIYHEMDDSWELYDLEADPRELSNIINTSPQADGMKQQITPRVGRFLKAPRQPARPLTDNKPVLNKAISLKRKRQCGKLIELTKQVVRQAFDRFAYKEIGITWTGGKDSGLTLWIIKKVCEERGLQIPKTIIIGEGDEFSEIEAFVSKYSQEWQVPLETCRNDDVLKAANYTLNSIVRVADLNERNRAELKRIGFEEDEFPFEAESYSGNHLMKTVVFNQFLEDNGIKAIFQGLRWDEHPARFDDEYFEDVEASPLVPAHTRIRPILHFTEKDLWDTYAALDIPYCQLYAEGYRSLGAKTSSKKSSDLPAWEQDLENTEERGGRRQDKEKAMERLRQLGYM
jgi:phosphoadenosine phosphosulfate reductase